MVWECAGMFSSFHAAKCPQTMQSNYCEFCLPMKGAMIPQIGNFGNHNKQRAHFMKEKL